MIAHGLEHGYYSSYHDSGLLVPAERDVGTSKRPASEIRLVRRLKGLFFQAPQSMFTNDKDLALSII